MRSQFPERRGSALMLTVILSVILATITASYLKMATNESKYSYQSFLRNAVLNLAEAGAEEAIWALNNEDTSSWSSSSGVLYKKLAGFNYSQAQSSAIQIAIKNPTSNPTIISRGILTLPNGQTMEKTIKIELRPRQVAPNGLTAKDEISFSGGNVTFDAYDSDSHSWFSSVDDGGTVGTTSIINDAANISNSDVFGSIATGGGSVEIGPNARVFDEGDINDYGSINMIPTGYVNTDLVTYDFRSDFPMITADTSSANVIGAITNTQSLGSGTYITSEIKLNNKQLNIVGDVTLIVTGDVAVGGNTGSINIDQSHGSLELYIAGDMSVAGNGIANVGSGYTPTPSGAFGVTPSASGYPKPENLMIYGIADASANQSISYSGNAALAAVIYAPEATVSLNGGGSGGEILGAIVASEIKVTGTYSFHYDVQLKDLFFEEDSFRMDSWNELVSASEKATYNSLFSSL